MKRSLLRCLAIGLLAVSLPAAAAVDPFYRNRMESGIRAFEAGNWDEAARQLRIGCFGYLDEPVELVQGLVRLALVEAARKDTEAFGRVFSRIVDAEEKLSAYSQASLPEELRRPFEEEVVERVPAQRLLSIAAFRPLAERAELARLAALPPSARRTALEERLAAEPGRPELVLELARLELETRRPALALDALDRLPAAIATEPRAACLRQQAASEAGSCERMDLELPFCAGVLDKVVEFRLECLAAAGRWQEAAELIDGLPAETRGKRRIARLERRVARQSQEAAPEESSAPSGEQTAAAPSAQPSSQAPAGSLPEASPPAPTVPAPIRPRPEVEQATSRPEPTPIDPARLRNLRGRITRASTVAELEGLMEEADQLARAHPSSREAQLLAAEIAYLSSEWSRSVAFFRRAGDLRPDEVNLAFYLAVALYETGEAAAAAELLRPIAARLERTRFVGSYIDRILAVGGPSAPPGGI